MKPSDPSPSYAHSAGDVIAGSGRITIDQATAAYEEYCRLALMSHGADDMPGARFAARLAVQCLRAIRAADLWRCAACGRSPKQSPLAPWLAGQ